MGKAGLRVLIGTLVVSVAYPILGSLAGSYFVERDLRKILDHADEQNLAIGSKLFNPFTLSAALQDVSLAEADGTRFLTVESVRLNFSILSLLQQRFILSDVSLRSPGLLVDVSVPPRPGLARLIAALSTMGEAPNDATGIRIDRASLKSGVVRLQKSPGRTALQGNPNTPIEMTLSGIDLQISHYQSGSVEPANLELSTKINETAVLRADGLLVPSTGAVEASVELVDLNLARVHPLFSSESANQHLSGSLRANGLLSHDSSHTRFAGELALNQLETGTTPQGQALFSTDELLMHGADIVAWPLRASAQTVELRQPQLELFVEATDSSTGLSIGPDPMLHGLLDAFTASTKTRTGDGIDWRVRPLSIDTLAISGGQLRITDPRFGQGVSIGLEQVAGVITSHTSEPLKTMSAQLSARMGESAPLTLGSTVRFSDDKNDEVITGELITEFSVQQTDASLLTAYISRFTGRELLSGTLKGDLRYRFENNKLAVSNTISIKQLVLGARSAIAPMNELPLDLAIALFTDSSGETHFEIPALSHLADSTGSIPAAIETELTRFISDVSTRPFPVLANLVGFREVGLNTIVFDPGSAAISPLAERQLATLSVVLDKRPGLGLRAISGHSRQVDRDALARRQISLHVTLAASTRPAGRPETAGIDFTDPKVQTVLDEFASTRLAANELARLKSIQQLNLDTASSGYYEAVFEALVAQEPVAENALRKLANFRAQSVIRGLESLGIASARLQLGNSQLADDPPVSLQVFAQAIRAENPALENLPNVSPDHAIFPTEL